VRLSGATSAPLPSQDLADIDALEPGDGRDD
jgi:hypothetical protein